MSDGGARTPIVLAIVASLAVAVRSAHADETVAPLEDNSFLLKEAYNQEPRVVQHILSWTRSEPGGDEVLTFSQEWPLFGRRHQLSYALPFESLGGTGLRGAGWGDIEIEYRYQWLDGSRLAAAPSLAVLLPSGDAAAGRGSGAAAGAVGLPLSVRWSSRLVAHTNLGFTYTGESGSASARVEYDLGQSLVWHMTPRLDPLVELAWSRSEPAGGGSGDREEGFLISPGLRWGYDFENGLQVVPGLAFPIGMGPQSGDSDVLFYLSFEHGF